MLFAHGWPGNLRQLENFVAKLCEHADMDEVSIVDQRIVGEVFKSQMSGTPSSGAEVVSQAAYSLSKVALTDSITTVRGGVETFTEAMRIAALDASGGDVTLAAELIEDSPSLLELTAQTIIDQKLLGPKE